MRAVRRAPLLIAAVSLAAVLLAGCREPTPTAAPTPTSQIALATPPLTPSPTATPLPYPGYKSPTPSNTPTLTPFGYPPPTITRLPVTPSRWPTQTPTPTRTITPTPRTTLDPAALSNTEAAALLPWIEVAAEPGYRLYQVSQTPYGVESLEWSPDGRYLWIQVATSGYESMLGPPTVPLIVGPQDRRVWTTNGEGDYPCGRHHEWSPDGRALVFYRAGQMWLTDADGENARSLPIVGGFPRFSPDGRSIAMMVYRTDGHTAFYDLWLLEVNAGVTRRLVENAGSGQFSWSPDGATLAHLGEAQETFPGRARLWLANLSGGDPIHVDTGELPGTEGCLGAPVWVLDGQKILVTVAFE